MRKNAEYFIEKVFREIQTLEDAKMVQKEVKEWILSADPSEIAKYRDSGAGEMLYMCCR